MKQSVRNRAARPPGRYPRLLLALMLASACASPARRSDALFTLEDARVTGAAAAPLLAALQQEHDLATRIQAARAVGRLQRPELMDSLIPLLAADELLLRAEAANAVAQAVFAADSAAVRRARDLLLRRLAAAQPGHELSVVARSLGRMAHENAAVQTQVAQRIAQRAGGTACDSSVRHDSRLDATAASTLFGVMHGLYFLARRARSLPCTAATLARGSASFRIAQAGDSAVWVRELAVLTLQAAQQADSAVLALAARDPDPRVRRLAFSSSRQRPLALARIDAGLRDSAAMVRIDAVQALRWVASPAACTLARSALRDSNPLVRGESVDAIAAACDRAIAVAVLDSLAARLPADTVSAAGSWHLAARALPPLATLEAGAVARRAAAVARHPVWQVRAALAQAAHAAHDTATLAGLLADRDANVRETAIVLLTQRGGAARERAVRAGLSDSAYQVVLVAAQGAKEVAQVGVQQLAGALARVSRRAEETARDPRVELLERIAEQGTAADSAALLPYVTDYDTLVARRAADVLRRWTGRDVMARPQPRAHSDPAADVAVTHLRVTVATADGDAELLVRLHHAEARATVARVLRLAQARYYDGLTFHRVVPNFVLQGGSPDANEYVGDGPYMRDEVGLRSHTRGTLGISTRGRDTGDAQFFINLVDNFRLDHNYTVFGEVERGAAALDRIAPGAVIRAVVPLRRDGR